MLYILGSLITIHVIIHLVIVVQWQSPVFELHLILGHNRCVFAFSGRVHPTDEKSA